MKKNALKPILFIVMCAVMLLAAACSTTKLKPSTPPLPSNLTAPLPKLNELKGDTGGDWLDWGVDTVQKYSMCVQRVSALIDAHEPTR